MRKSYFISILAISMILGITGCGNNTAAVATEAPAETIEYQGEGAVQGEIKSEDYLAALEAEGEQYEQYAEPEATEEATPEVAETSTGSTNIEDYWQGSEYFDLEGYLLAMGAYRIHYLTQGDERISIYGDFPNNWSVAIPTYKMGLGNQCIIQTIYYGDGDAKITSCYNMDGNLTPVTIDQIDSQCSLGVFDMLEDITLRVKSANDTNYDILNGCPWFY